MRNAAAEPTRPSSTACSDPRLAPFQHLNLRLLDRPRGVFAVSKSPPNTSIAEGGSADHSSLDDKDVTLRPARPEDEDFLLEVYAGTRAEERALVGWDDAQWGAFIRMQFTAQKRDYEARYSASGHSVILAGGRPVGRLWVDRGEEEIRLVDIALLPAHQGTGIGSVILRRLIAEARQAEKPLRHMVYKANADAVRFYERLGFSVTGEIPSHYLMEL